MKVTDYEKTYKSVSNAVKDTQYLDAVVDFLRKQNEPVTCATIGKAVFGDKYSTDRAYSSRMGQMLWHLRVGGFVKVEKHKGDPIEIEVGDWIVEPDANGEPPRVTVHDDKGREFTAKNPYYTGPYIPHEYWGTVKKTITPTIRTYTWIA